MRPILLIAANYVREQRWPTLGLCLYAVGNAVLFANIGGHRVGAEDVYFYTRQQALFIVIFGLFLMSSAIYNDRRSRRILAVLSKAISRIEYLGALWLGVMAITVIYATVIALCDLWLCHKAVLHAGPLLIAIVLACVAATATASVTLFFSTVLHPLFASAAAIVAIGVAGAWPHTPHMLRTVLSPSYQLLERTLNSPTLQSAGNGAAIVFALIHAALFFVLASVIFNYKDVAVAIE